MKTKALFWIKENDVVRCKLCPHECLIKQKKCGICNVRFNEDGVLYTYAFNNLCAIAIDPIEKKPLYNFLPRSKTFSIALAGCNLKCKNCQNAHISQCIDYTEQILSSLQVIELSKKHNCPSISFTYTEPTIYYEYMLETAQLAKQNGLKTVIVSNGYINKEPLLNLIPYIDAANIDVKAFSEETYKRLTGGSLKPVLETIKLLVNHNVHVELTYLLVPKYSEDFNQIENFINWLNEQKYNHVPIHFSRFFPRYLLSNLNPTPLEGIKEAVNLAYSKGIKNVYAGNV